MGPVTLHTPKAPETTVQRMVTNAMHVQNIEVETGWTRDDIKACAMRMGYALDAASQRFRRAPQRKPAPAGIVLAAQTSGEEVTSAVRELASHPDSATVGSGTASRSPLVSSRPEVQAAWVAFFEAFTQLLRVVEVRPRRRPRPSDRATTRPTPLTHGATQSQIRDWARTQGLDVNPRGTVRRDIADAYAAAHQETP